MRRVSVFLLSILATGIIGYFLGLGSRFVETETIVKQVDDFEYRDKYNQLKEKVGVLAEVDYSEYVRLKESEEKFAKADEMLGKMMLIFLADLGLRLSEKNESVARQSASRARTLTKIPREQTSNVKPVKKSLTHTKEVENRHWVKYGKWIEEERDSRELKDLLEKAKVENFGSELLSSTKIRPELFRKLVGEFRGQMVFLRKDIEPADVLLSINGKIDNGVVRGDNRFELSRNGEKPFTSMSDRGDIDKNFKSFSGNDSDAMIVKVSPNKYLQLFEARGVGGFVGNVYDKEDLKFARTATLTLERL